MVGACLAAAAQVVADIARSLGIKAFWHPAFGELPTAHAKQYVVPLHWPACLPACLTGWLSLCWLCLLMSVSVGGPPSSYGDAGFLAMMWLKIVSVWVAVRLGFDVLFQDADLVSRHNHQHDDSTGLVLRGTGAMRWHSL